MPAALTYKTREDWAVVAGRHDHLITIKFPLLCHYRVIFFSGRSSVSTEHMNNVLASHTVVSSLYLLSYREIRNNRFSRFSFHTLNNDVGLNPADCWTNAMQYRAVVRGKEIQIILRLFLVIAIYCQASSSQIKSITQPPALLAGWEGSLSRYIQ